MAWFQHRLTRLSRWLLHATRNRPVQVGTDLQTSGLRIHGNIVEAARRARQQDSSAILSQVPALDHISWHPRNSPTIFDDAFLHHLISKRTGMVVRYIGQCGSRAGQFACIGQCRRCASYPLITKVLVHRHQARSLISCHVFLELHRRRAARGRVFQVCGDISCVETSPPDT